MSQMSALSSKSLAGGVVAPMKASRAGTSRRTQHQQPWRAAAVEGGKPTILTNAEGGRTTPSVVAFTEVEDYLQLQRLPDEEYMKEYQGLKDQLMDNTRKSGAVVAAYLLLTVDGQAALCALLGTAASCVYLALLYRDVDNYKEDTVVPMVVADRVEGTLLRRLAKAGCAYRQALNRRLLVPVVLVLLATAYNRSVGPEASIDLLHEGCLLLGFLSYKLALVVKLVDELSPKDFVDPSESRPRVEVVDDDLDMLGRPKRQLLRMPKDVLAKP
ncbi:Heat shock protein 7, chloroplastic [Tetrabaena socialis]|uniref:Heat shock protein 7, chloroplastic n=1 Tax=Tetrabaena socialis TaxID=47790 RepID=A0A2J7ZKN6_9CHLO|nr:Heat shock protein 7, chloroplastic [Tetrabaena socialis]|eukprot:PNH00832.1 Heat shock protein 7, chloroplastic [Tetrabaena socialis]